MFHTYHPDNIESIVYHYQEMTQNTASFEINQIDLYNNDTQSVPLVHNVEPSRKLAPPTFPPYTTDNLQFLKKSNFQYSDLNDSEYIQLCQVLIENKECYVSHKIDVHQISTPFRIRLKPNASLQTQRPTKVPILHRGKLNAIKVEFDKSGTIRQFGPTPHKNQVWEPHF